MTASASPPPAAGQAPSARQRAWAELGAELTPAKSLQRLDAATARVVSTISVVATLLTGFGLVAAGLSSLPGAGRVLAAIAAGLAFLAVLAALAAQTVTITRGLNPRDLRAVERWYRRRFAFRAPLTVAASVLLVLASAAAGTAVLIALGTGAGAPTISVTRTPEPSGPGTSVTVDVTFRGLDEGQVATLTVAVDGATLATAGFTPAADGTATRSLTVPQVPAGGVVTVEAKAADTRCTARLDPSREAEVSCPAP